MPSLAQLAYVGSLFEPMHQVGRVTPPLPLQRDTVLLFGHRLRLNAIAIGTPPSMTDLVYLSILYQSRLGYFEVSIAKGLP